MAEEPDNLVLQLLRSMRAENSVRFDEIDAVLNNVRRTLAGYELRFDAIEERVEAVRERTVSAIGDAANTSRAHVDLRVEKLEAGR